MYKKVKNIYHAIKCGNVSKRVKNHTAVCYTETLVIALLFARFLKIRYHFARNSEKNKKKYYLYKFLIMFGIKDANNSFGETTRDSNSNKDCSILIALIWRPDIY